MSQSDVVAVEIFDDLKNYLFSNNLGHDLAGNIIGLFFHDLMVHFTGILIHRDAKEEYGKEIDFPFVNMTYSKIPFEIENFKILEPKSRSLVKQIKRSSLLPFGVGQAIPMSLGRDRIEKTLLSILGCSHDFTTAYIVRRSEQIKILFDVIEELCKKYSISNHDQIIKNWSRYAELHTTSQQRLLHQNAVILGTRCQMQNRKLAVNYLQQGKEVLGMTHGEASNAIFDEPIFGYADCSYCTTLIDYGSDRGFGELNRPLIEPKRVIYRTSRIVRKVSSEAVDNREILLDSPRLLYIPTMYSANKLYGPFRNFEDAVYRDWQKLLISLFPNVTVKIHPKSLANWNYKCRVESRNLITCISEYEGILLDYCSTAATIAFSTDRPIIYFDLGLRNLTAEYKQDIKQRCQYIDISNIEDSNDLLREKILYKLRNQEKKINSQMLKYSIAEDNQEGIFSNLYRLLKRL